MSTPEKDKLHCHEIVVFEVGFKLVLAYLVLTLVFACVVAILFPDVWWLWSWTPSP